MALNQGIGAPRILDNGNTALESANQFVRIRTDGVRDLVKNLMSLASQARSQQVLRRVCAAGGKPIKEKYASLAMQHEATGNLAKSVTSKYKGYEFGGVEVVGPRQTGNRGSQTGAESGNHAWLTEFGSGPRKPGSRGRRTYVNVHQMINGKMTRHSTANDEQFKRMSRGYYFLMGSINERAGSGGKAGYSRDFAPDKEGNDTHPIVLHPGETLEPMPAYGLMQKTIASESGTVLSIMRAMLEKEIAIRGG